MLDLQKLEALVDEALENETSTSLLSWLMSQRNCDLHAYLGDGKVEQRSTSSSTFVCDENKTIIAVSTTTQTTDSYDKLSLTLSQAA